MNINDFPDEQDDLLYADSDEWLEPQPFWTRRRIFLTIFAILMVIALLLYTLPGLFVAPPPPPTLAPGSLI